MQKIFLFLFVLYACSAFSQNPQIDSLRPHIFTGINDTHQVKRLNALSFEFLFLGLLDSAESHAARGLDLSQKINYQKGIADAYMATGMIHRSRSEYAIAIDYYYKALKIYEADGYLSQAATCYNNIGNIYYSQKNTEKALENHHEALRIRKQIADKKNMAASYNNIGLVYAFRREIDKALENYFLALALNKELKNEKWIGSNYNNIGIIYAEKGEPDKALEYFIESLKLKEAYNDQSGITYAYNSIAGAYGKKGDHAAAISWYSKGLKMAKEFKYTDQIIEAYKGLALNYSEQKDFKRAYENVWLYARAKDSVFTEQSSRQTAEMGAKYETEKKEQKIKMLKVEQEKNAAIALADNRQKNFIIWSVAGGFLLLLLFALYIFRSLSITRRQKHLIEQKNILTNHQKRIIEENNKNILDSIHYAERIQHTLLPSEKYIEKNLKRLMQKWRD